MKEAVIRFIKEKIPESRIDYVEVACPSTLESLKNIRKNQKVLVALAVHVGGARLIDNILVKV